MKYAIGNWKANKNTKEAAQWIKKFFSFDLKSLKGRVTVIICPPYPLIPLLKSHANQYTHVYVGSQDVSVLGGGAHTGEVAAKSLAGLVDFAIIGHSERRSNFGETDQILEKKVVHAVDEGIEPIYCVRGPRDRIPTKVRFVAYEPVHAIGTGVNEPADKVLDTKKKLDLPKDCVFIYGGSVTKDNAKSYLRLEGIDGFLPGGASLDPTSFWGIITCCLV